MSRTSTDVRPESAEFPTGVKEVVTLLGKSKMRGQAVLHTMKAGETEDIPLVKLTPIVLEMGHRNLTNRVNYDAVCEGVLPLP